MKRVVLGVIGVLGTVLVLALVAGVLLPRDHVAASTVTLRQPPESVWAVVRDLGATPRWWSEVTVAEPVADPAGREIWRQEAGGFTMQLAVTEATAPTRLVTVIDAPPDAAFGGRWAYELEQADGGTRVVITEAGWVANPLFRVMARLSGPHRTLDSYLMALGARFGEAVTPEHVVP